MTCKKDVAVVRTIGIDTGKNTLHMIGLDEKGAIVLREKVSRNRIAALPVPRSLRSAMELPSRKGETLPLGLAWCRNRCRPVIARSLAASRSAETAICVCSSSKAPAPFCSDRRVGQSTVLDPGSRLRRGVCIATF